MDNRKMEGEEIFYSGEVQKIASTICELAKECWERGLSDSTGFSISQIIPNTSIAIVDRSGTGFRRNKITPEDLLLIDLDGNLIYQPKSNNSRMAPVNITVHLEGFKKSEAKACIHWHDPYSNAFACYGKTIHPLTLQSKLIGDVPCVVIDDREQKRIGAKKNLKIEVPSGLHARSDVYYVMKQVGESIGNILSERNDEFKRHGVVLTHYEHGLFSFGRQVEEAFENGYRSVRNAQAIIFSRLLKDYPDDKSLKNSGPGDKNVAFG